MPPAAKESIPTSDQEALLGKTEPCGLSATGDHWESVSETGQLKRITPYLYSGFVVLHKKEGDEKLEIQYRVLGIYNNDFQVPNSPTRPG